MVNPRKGARAAPCGSRVHRDRLLLKLGLRVLRAQWESTCCDLRWGGLEELNGWSTFLRSHAPAIIARDFCRGHQHLPSAIRARVFGLAHPARAALLLMVPMTRSVVRLWAARAQVFPILSRV